MDNHWDLAAIAFEQSGGAYVDRNWAPQLIIRHRRRAYLQTVRRQLTTGLLYRNGQGWRLVVSRRSEIVRVANELLPRLCSEKHRSALARARLVAMGGRPTPEGAAWSDCEQDD